VKTACTALNNEKRGLKLNKLKKSHVVSGQTKNANQVSNKRLLNKHEHST